MIEILEYDGYKIDEKAYEKKGEDVDGEENNED